MTEDLTLKIQADVSQLRAELAKVSASLKDVGNTASQEGAKVSKSFDGLTREVKIGAAAFIAFRVGMRVAREALAELGEAAGKTSLLHGELKDSAVVAQNSVKEMAQEFKKFEQTAMGALAPVVGFVAEDLRQALAGATKGMEQNKEAADDLASAWGVLKTVAATIGGVFQAVFGGLQAVLALSMLSVGKLVEGFGAMAGVVSKELGDSVKSMGSALVAASNDVGDKMEANLKAAGSKLGAALSGSMYEETMTGFDKYKTGIAAKAKEISAMAALELKGDKAAKREQEEAEGVAKLLKEWEKTNIVLLTQDKIQADILEMVQKRAISEREAYLIATGDEQALKRKALLDAERAKAIQKQTDEYVKLIKVQEAAKEATDKNYMDKTGDLYSGNKKAPEIKADQSDTEKEYFKTRLEKELEYYTSSVELADEWAAQILAIDDYLNGTLEEQAGQRRAQEILNEKKLSKLKKTTWQEDAGALSSSLRDMATISESFGKKGFEMAKIFGASAIAVDTVIAAQRAFSAGAAIDAKLGTPLVFATSMATIASAAGIANAAKLASQSYGGGGGGAAGGGGFAGTVPSDTSNQGGPGGSGPGGSSTVNVSLVGDRFGAAQVRGLMDQIREESKDGKRLTKVNVL